MDFESPKAFCRALFKHRNSWRHGNLAFISDGVAPSPPGDPIANGATL